MNVGSLVGFKKELFFEGAVQLGWFHDNPDKAISAAENFVFHGPRYHGVADGADSEVNSAYKLKDTASFLQDLLFSLSSPQQEINTSPYVLAIAGYGAGKSHFALTASRLLSQPTSVESSRILKNISAADSEIGERVSRLAIGLKKPVLVVALDGISNFHLGREFNLRVIRQLKAENVDLQPIADISPRFQYAQDFVRRNYEIRQVEFKEEGLGGEDSILEELQERNEDTYQKVDSIYFRANGTKIPVVGDESVQILIETICNTYCGEDGYFSGLAIIFDEFGRYLEYVAEQPSLAGDSALQQIFQGIQDSKGKAHFVGFIQYELSAYLNRFSQRDLKHLKRFTSRFDSAEKLHLSTNLETIFANLIHKKDERQLSLALEDEGERESWKKYHKLFAACLPGFAEMPVWANFEKFFHVIVRGCWPLHPLTTWFLTRQQDVIQSRSALVFIKEAIDSESSTPIKKQGVLFSISVANLVLKRMLSEMVAAEQIQGGGIVGEYLAIVGKYKSRIEDSHKKMLISAVVLEKLCIKSREKEVHDKFLVYLSGLTESDFVESQKFLSREIGALEWNQDLSRYELISDAATRSQFIIMMHKKTAKITNDTIGEVFSYRASKYAGLSDISPDFHQKKNISSTEWYFRASFSVSNNFHSVLSKVVEERKNAFSHDDPKGHIIYFLVQTSDDYDAAISNIKKSFEDLIGCECAPIWTVVLHDRQGKISENLSRIHIIENKFDQKEQELYSRFFAEEKSNASISLKDAVDRALLERDYYISGFEDVPSGRMNFVANKVFEEIYPDVVSFLFDGFSTKSGSGPRDCFTLIKALVSRSVNGEWLSLQQASLQNRTIQLLVKNWKVLDGDGVLLKSIGNKSLETVFSLIEKKHQDDSSRTLGDTFYELVSPPYGFNSSSAGVLIGLLLSKESLPWAISHNGISCTFEEWLTKALPKKRGLYSFDIKELDKSNLLFLEKTSYQRWNSILIDIESKSSYSKLSELFDEAYSRAKSDPIPELLMSRFKHLETKAKDAKAKLRLYESDLCVFEDRVAAAEKVINVDRLIGLGSDIATKMKTMREEVGVWDKIQIDALNDLLADVRELLGTKVRAWIGHQTCNRWQDIDSFKRRLEQKKNELRLIGLVREERMLEEQKHKVVSQLDKRAAYELSINKASDLIRQPLPTLLDKAISLSAQISEVDKLLNVLTSANLQINASDIDELISDLQSRKILQCELRDQQLFVFDEILSRPAESVDDVDTLLRLIREQQIVFSATDIENRVDSAYRLLLRYKEDMTHWGSYEVPFEEVEKLLDEQIAKKILEIKKQYDGVSCKGFGDVEKVYWEFKNRILNSLKDRSARWLEGVVPDLDDIEKKSMGECERLIEKMKIVPAWVSFSDREQASNISINIQKYIDEYVEQERVARADFWMNSMRKESEQAACKGRVYCDSLLSKLNNIPEFVGQDSYGEIDSMRKMVQGYIDGLHIDDIFERICGLSEPLKKDLIEMLKKLYPAFFA